MSDDPNHRPGEPTEGYDNGTVPDHPNQNSAAVGSGNEPVDYAPGAASAHAAPEGAAELPAPRERPETPPAVDYVPGAASAQAAPEGYVDGTQDAEGEDGGYDPANDSVADVKQYVTDNPDARADVLAAERDGKNRTTLVSWLEQEEGADDGDA